MDVKLLGYSIRVATTGEKIVSATSEACYEFTAPRVGCQRITKLTISLVIGRAKELTRYNRAESCGVAHNERKESERWTGFSPDAVIYTPTVFCNSSTPDRKLP